MKICNFPRIGMRIIKSAVAVLMCYVIFFLRGRVGIPFYSMIGALWCIQPYTGKTHQMALQRASGTLIGAVYGLIAILLEIYVLGIYADFAGYILNALLIIPVLYTTVLLEKKNTSYFSCVVYLSIAVNHMADADPLVFVGNRVLDTFIGIAVGIIVNSVRLPRKKITDCLFVGELDDMLSPVKQELSAYSKIEINRMIGDGMRFTVASMRTPADLMKLLDGVDMQLPVVAMNGAVLYDMRENAYLKAYVISHDSCMELVGMIRSAGMNCFINALCDDTLVIYYDKLENEAEIDIFRKMRRSPLRNYVRREPNSKNRTIYIMAIDRTPVIEKFCKRLDSAGFTGHFKVLHYRSDDYPEFSYIKIYNKNAGTDNMIRYLMESQKLSAVQLVGADSNTGADLDRIVKRLKKTFEPLFLANK